MNNYTHKAKLKNSNTWVYGAYLKMLPYTPNPVGHIHILETEYKHLIIKEGFSDWNMPRDIVAYEIIPETVCINTGIQCKNGCLYTNDLIKVDGYYNGEHLLQVKRDNPYSEIYFYDDADGCKSTWHVNQIKELRVNNNFLDCEIVGNIYDK